LMNELHEDSPMLKVLEALKESKENTYSNYARDLINEMKLQPKVIDMSKEAEELDKLYPMIEDVGYYFDGKKVADYVSQMDMLRELLDA